MQAVCSPPRAQRRRGAPSGHVARRGLDVLRLAGSAARPARRGLDPAHAGGGRAGLQRCRATDRTLHGGPRLLPGRRTRTGRPRLVGAALLGWRLSRGSRTRFASAIRSTSRASRSASARSPSLTTSGCTSPRSTSSRMRSPASPHGPLVDSRPLIVFQYTGFHEVEGGGYEGHIPTMAADQRGARPALRPVPGPDPRRPELLRSVAPELAEIEIPQRSLRERAEGMGSRTKGWMLRARHARPPLRPPCERAR